jgi:hypothetical protein
LWREWRSGRDRYVFFCFSSTARWGDWWRGVEQIRRGFYVILVLFLVALPILWKVDMAKGSVDAERYDQEAKEVREEGREEEEELLRREEDVEAVG